MSIPVSGRRSFEDTELVKKARARDLSDAQLIMLSDYYHNRKFSHQEAGNIAKSLSAVLKRRTNGGKYELDGTDLLHIIKGDIEEDIDGMGPMSGIDYMWITLRVLMLWMDMEDKLAACQNRLYVQAYRELPREGVRKQVELAGLALPERKSADRRDHVYGAMGLVGVGHAGSMIHDYEKIVKKLLIDVTMALIEASGSLLGLGFERTSGEILR
ncbi:hypothetical protein DL769_002742 [Monosporascus sp. CRB-8-3]|nr:hypothetical protein DL769_002742 [Monosporascus sp. CRB-8-3]